MARPLRLEFEGAIYHVTSRGNERRPIFRSNRDRSVFLQFLGEAVQRFRWNLTAWALMTNHFHLVLRTPDANLSRGMHWLNGRYAAWFNKTRQRTGHLFQGRFHAFVIDEQSYLAEVVRYVVLNPVRAKIVARPEIYRWSWSSYRATAGFDAAPAWLDVQRLHAIFDRQTSPPEAAYREFVLAKVDANERLWDKASHGIFLGAEAWAKEMRALVESKPRSSDHPVTQRAIGRPKMAVIVVAVAKASGVTATAIRETRGGALRRLVAWLGWHEGVATLQAIAASLRLRSEGHITGLIKRCEHDLARDETLLALFDAALVVLRS